MKFRYTNLLAVLLCSVFALGFWGGDKKNTVASVEREVITADEFNQRLSTYPPQFAEQLQQKETKVQILDQMIDELVLYVAAKRSNYTKSKEFKDRMEQARRQILVSMLIRDKVDSNINITEQDIQNYFQSNQQQFAETEQRRAQHILVKTREEALGLRRRARRGENFAKLARENSIDSQTAQNGGELGWISRGQIVKEVEDAVFSLGRVGAISKVVNTNLGFHVIRLQDKRTRAAITLQQVAQQIKQGLEQEKKRSLTVDYIAKTKQQYKVSKDISKI